MSKIYLYQNEIYHLHKDCKYYQECKEEIIADGENVNVRFTCPMFKHSQSYNMDDLHSIKWACTKFIPRKESYQEHTKY